MSEGMIGEIRLFGGNYAPRNWALCNGQILEISQNQALFSVIGTNYGGDGRTTFALPKIVPVFGVETDTTYNDPYTHYIICLEGVFPERSY